MPRFKFLAAISLAVSVDAAARLQLQGQHVAVLARELQADADAHATFDPGLWHPEWPSGSPWASTARTTTAAADLRQDAQAAADAQAATLRQTAAEPNTAKAPRTQRTYMKCLGTTTATRACHFQDVYYDIDSKHFIYYGPEGAEAEVFGQPVKAGDPWLRLIRGDRWKKQYKREQFFLDWRAGKPLPPAGRVAGFEQPLYLRAPLHTRSYGHFLRDNMLPLIDLPMRFGRDPVDFDWVRWTSALMWTDWEEESHVVEHYRGLHNNRPSVTWPEVLEKALEGQPSSVKFIRFSEIMAGQGPLDMYTHFGSDGADSPKQLSQWAHMCDPFPFTAMREIAYRNHGLQVASVPELEPFVLFMNGRQGEKRYTLNVDDILPQIQAKFPGVRMEHVQISKHTLQEQLEYLAKATVVVTNIGSRSFRLIYLPNGATTILVGPPEYAFMTEPTQQSGKKKKRRVKPKREQNTTPFYEIDNCWGYIGYVNMLQYHVTTEAEVEKTKPWMQWQDARNSNILLDVKKLTTLLRVALQESDCESRPYSGAGTLAAYNA